jgi:hypothetical protein
MKEKPMHRISRYRPTPATAIAMIALLVALGGTGYAAIVLPANSVGTAQVIDGSLLTKDFKAGQIPAGKPGPAGPSNAFSQSVDGPVTLGIVAGTVASLQFPKPGSYVIWAKANLFNTGSGDEQVACELVAGAATDRNTVYLPKPASNEEITNVVVQTFAASGTANLQCASATGHVEAHSIELVSVKVGSLASS